MLGNKKLVGGELSVPILFIVAGITIAGWKLDVESSNYINVVGFLLFLLTVFVGALLSLYPISKLWELRQQRWMEEQAKEEREILRGQKAYQSSDRLKYIKERYETFESLLPQNNTELIPAHEALKKTLSKELLPQLAGLDSKEKEQFKAFHRQFQLLKSLKPANDAGDEEKANYQTMASHLNQTFNTYALDWLKNQL